MGSSQNLMALTCIFGVGSVALAGSGNWVDFANETAQRMPTPLNDPSVSTNDGEEKDYAWGDVDKDGDIDLLVARKQPFTTTGKEANVLFMNEGIAEGHAANGVLVDRTAQFASASLTAGDDGFMEPTNDRDVILVDVDNDGWLDIVTATTLTDNQNKLLSHPRIHMNLGEDGGGNWLGFRHEDARIPLMEGNVNAGPRFCSVAAGDVTGDGFADLYFGDYDSGGAQIVDYNNRLLINDGTGNFTDESQARMGSNFNYDFVGNQDYLFSAFGAASVIADMNDDGRLDVIKQTSLNAPTHIAIVYNDLGGDGTEGVFDEYDVLYSLSPYFIQVGHLNDDNKLDIVITDDGTDRYLINTGNDAQGRADFTELTLPSGASGGFGGNSLIVDLDNNGVNDIVITDVDVDGFGCDRRTHIYRNNGVSPNPSFNEEGTPIPTNMLTGTHDAAIFDINGDGWLDMVLGRCNTTEVWMNEPPVGVQFLYPQGRPTFVAPNQTSNFQLQVDAIGGGSPVPGSAEFFVSIDGGSFNSVPLVDLGNDLYEAALPSTDCPGRIEYYFTTDLDSGGTFSDPSGAPFNVYSALAAEGLVISLRDTLEDGVIEPGWSVANDASLTTGAWEVVEPNGTLSGGTQIAPDSDATQGAANVKAYVTEDGGPGASAGSNDIDGGPTILTSPAIDLDGTDATISYDRWFMTISGTADVLQTEVSNDGTNWVFVHQTGSTAEAWENASFLVSDFVTPSATVQVRFIASDSPNDSVTEAGIDNFQVEEIDCGATAPPCPWDCRPEGAPNGIVNFDDLVAVVNAISTQDLDCDVAPDNGDGTFGNGVITFDDLIATINNFGPCPGTGK